jgi:iron complex outermembrane recepter protein
MIIPRMRGDGTWRRVRLTGGSAILHLALALVATPLSAQSAGWIRAVVIGEGGQPVVNATVQVAGTPLGALTGAMGGTVLGPVSAGTQEVRVSQLGFQPRAARVVVVAGDTISIEIALAAAPIELGGIQVSVLRPDLRPEAELPERQIREANPHDIGAVMRTAPGMDAVRRGALGLDPVVRGLRDTQIGAYVDGMRTLPGGPAGMDTPLSHVDPSSVRAMEVIKGPYALTWGAGNMSAIRIETHPLPNPGASILGVNSFFGYDTNLSATEAGLELSGALSRVRYTGSGAWRQGGDYTSGAGVVIPSRFTSGEVRGRLGFDLSPTSVLTASAGYQEQDDIAYPGRPLDADWFDTYNASLRWEHRPVAGRVRLVDAQAYVYAVDHGMNNDHKPTALPNPNRTPPFPLRIVTLSGVRMYGGRAATEITPGAGWTLEVGGDVYTADHDAHRETSRRDTDMFMNRSLIWGGARITDAGLFARGERRFGRVISSGTMRVDLVDARADSASAFFLQNASDLLDSRETNLSGALTLTLPLTSSVSVSAGAGSVVRTAEANERFSDRAPAKKAQIGAEFIGDPRIRPERSTQVDVWLEADYPRVAASVNVFARRLDDHITLERTDLPRQSAMSAPMVFRYVNGDAEYYGAEASVITAVAPTLTLSTSAGYLYGHDLTLDEPALGVTPLRGQAGLRWQPLTNGTFVDLSSQVTGSQDRVATTRGEIPTPGYTTVDVQGGMPLLRGAFLRVGVNNLLDRDYVNHLNARSPFTGQPIAEPGRVLFSRLTYRF